MDKAFFKQCIKKEVYGDYITGRLSLIDKIWCRYYRPRSNSVFLIRKFQYYTEKCKSGGKVTRLWSTFLARSCTVKLIRRYSIFIHPEAKIGLGLRIIHPAGLYIANATIGDNATFFQNCTIGVKQMDDDKKGKTACIGDNLIMYANSMILGNIAITDDVIVAANSCLMHGTDQSGIYIGTPAMKQERTYL